jgi:hypothetical protein
MGLFSISDDKVVLPADNAAVKESTINKSQSHLRRSENNESHNNNTNTPHVQQSQQSSNISTPWSTASMFESWISSTSSGAQLVYHNPSYLLLISSIPLLTGAVMGYRKAFMTGGGETTSYGSSTSFLSQLVFPEDVAKVKKVAQHSGKTTSSSASKVNASRASFKPSSSILVRAEPATLAASALGIGSLLSLGGVGLMAAGVFYASGAESMQDLTEKWRQWTPRKLRQWEQFCGIARVEDRHKLKYASDPDVQQVKQLNLDEDEEVEYYKRKYIPELYEDEDEGEGEGVIDIMMNAGKGNAIDAPSASTSINSTDNTNIKR